MLTNLVSISSVKIGKWSVSGSVYKNDSICIVAILETTNEAIIRYFIDEELALIFVNGLGKSQLLLGNSPEK